MNDDTPIICPECAWQSASPARLRCLNCGTFLYKALASPDQSKDAAATPHENAAEQKEEEHPFLTALELLDAISWIGEFFD